MSDTVTAGRATVQFYSSPHTVPNLDPQPALLAMIAGAKASLLVGIYSITLPAVAQALIAKHQSGIPVRMLVDAGEATGATSQVPALVAAGIDLRYWGSNYRLMHAKCLVADSRYCAWGSYNFSGLAESDDIEILTTANDPTLGAYFTSLIQNGYTAGKAPS